MKNDIGEMSWKQSVDTSTSTSLGQNTITNCVSNMEKFLIQNYQMHCWVKHRCTDWSRKHASEIDDHHPECPVNEFQWNPNEKLHNHVND